MATDILNRTIGKANAFSADQAVLTFASSTGFQTSGTPLLVQNLQLNYQVPVTMMFDMSSSDLNFIRGRGAGNGAIGTVYGPAKIQTAFMQQYGDVCRITNNRMEFTINSTNCAVDGVQQTGTINNSLSCVYSVITTVGYSGSAQDMMINQSLGFMFGFLEVK